ncbi:MAG: GNAT family N-acetyltransferase [Bacteroidetes bacterium]|nr:GNAT family N-acetyltransferase [Bacteroidota bacterium]
MFRIIREWQNYREHVLLRDGSGLTLRFATQADASAVESLVNNVSQESRYFRFMAGVSYLPKATIEEMCIYEPRERASLLATLGDESSESVVGIGSYASLAVRNAAEVSFLVADKYHGKGIGTLLLERLAGIAAANGLVAFEAEMLSDNDKMMTVFRDAGFEIMKAAGGSTIHIEFPVSGNAAVRERAELRDRLATANSLSPLISPSSIAVVGASRDANAVGSLVFRHILESNFTGTVYPVNSQAASIQGVRAYSSIASLPEHPDLIVIAVPASNVLDVVREGVDIGAKGTIVLSAGFADIGEQGAKLQNELVEFVRSNGMRLIGPNCLGIINTNDKVNLNASLAGLMPLPGKVGFFSHTEALGIVILDYAVERGISFSTFVSGGNRGDVSGNDLLEYWEEDPSTDIVLLYLERFGNPRRFARVARRISYKKPILCVKSARNKAGREAAQIRSSDTETDLEVDALFQQAGVIRAETLEEMFDITMLLAHQPLPKGSRVAIISNAGGALTICADTCEANGLSVANENVMNLGPLAVADDYERVTTSLMEKENVDSLIAIFACIGGCDPQPIGRAIRRGTVFAQRSTKTDKPVLLCLMGTAKAVQVATSAAFQTSKAEHYVFPSYRFPESAALALARVTEYAKNRLQPQGRLLWYEDVDVNSAHSKLKNMVDAKASSDGIMKVGGKDSADILSFFGLSVDSPQKISGTAQTSGTEVYGECQIGIRSDPHFGPLIVLNVPGKQPIQRITPLTDRDTRAMLEDIGVSGSEKCEQLLGRISQMVEELPWLWGMTAKAYLNKEGQPTLYDVELAFKP